MTSGQGTVLYDIDGDPLSVEAGTAIPAATSALIGAGSDGTNARFIKVDSSGNQIMTGLGTAGSPAGGVITIQGDPSGTPLPISGNITASNASVDDNDQAIPAFSTLIGGSDGTNLRPLRVFDADTGGGQQWILGVGLRKSAGGGSVEFGTSSDPIRVDPTGTTTQPTSASQNGTWTVQPGNTANTTPWLITINQGGNSATVTGSNALKVDGSAVTQPVSGTVTVTQSTASNLRAQLASESTTGTSIPSTAVMVGGSDGANLRALFLDSSGRQIVIGAAANGAAATGNPVLIAGSDGTDARSLRTATDGTLRVDPTGTTTQPVSGTVAATQSGTWTVQQGTPPWSVIGPGASGAAVSGNPVRIAGSDGTNTRDISTDTSGRQVMVGAAADGSPITGNPVLMAGQDGINTQSILTDTIGRLITVGAAPDGTTVTGNPVLMGGQDGTNVQSIVTDTSGRQVVVGSTVDGTTLVGNPVPVAGVDSDGYVQSLLTDGYGKLQVVFTETSGTSVTRRITQNIATNTTVYSDYTVPGGSTFSVSSYYVGGSGVCRSSLSKHTSSTVTFVSNGDFENAGQITPWAAVTGTFGGGTPDSNSTQFQTGAASMRWTYSNSATALARRQTFTPVQDFSGYRYIRVKFYNDTVAATTRTISVVIAAGTPTRTYSLSGTTGTSPFTNNTWITLTCELENPTSSTGTGFDLTAISTITLSMQDAANRSGTVYWDTLRFEDQLEVRHRIYSSTGDTISAPLNPVEIFNEGESLYLIIRNTGNTTQEFTAIAAGTLT